MTSQRPMAPSSAHEWGASWILSISAKLDEWLECYIMAVCRAVSEPCGWAACSIGSVMLGQGAAPKRASLSDSCADRGRLQSGSFLVEQA